MDLFMIKRIAIIVISVLCAAFIIMVSIIGIRTINGNDPRPSKEKTTKSGTTTIASTESQSVTTVANTHTVYEISDISNTTAQDKTKNGKTSVTSSQRHTTQTSKEPESQKKVTTQKVDTKSYKSLQPQIDALKKDFKEEINRLEDLNVQTDSPNSEVQNNLKILNDGYSRIEALENQLQRSDYSDEQYKNALAEIENLKSIVAEVQASQAEEKPDAIQSYLNSLSFPFRRKKIQTY